MPPPLTPPRRPPPPAPLFGLPFAVGPGKGPCRPVVPWAGRAVAHAVHRLAVPPPQCMPMLLFDDQAVGADELLNDGGVMLDAVATRLRRGVERAGAALRTVPASGGLVMAPGHPLVQLQHTVLECAQALAQWQAVFVPELARLRQAEHALQRTMVALASARAELLAVQAVERDARHQALHDSLTTLPNRACFHQQLDRLLRGATPQAPLAVLYLDLDGFKQINDHHGHAVGDEVLRTVALRLRHALRAEDLVSRLGGDEFGCVLQGMADKAQLAGLARQLHDAVAAPVVLAKLRLSVQASIGIALYPADGQTTDMLLCHADAAMFRAKRSGSRHGFYVAPVAALSCA